MIPARNPLDVSIVSEKKLRQISDYTKMTIAIVERELEKLKLSLNDFINFLLFFA